MFRVITISREYGSGGGYIRYHFDQDWRNPHLYHLMICSGLGLDRAADAILCAAGLSGSTG